MDMKQIRDAAREKLKPHCRVCPVCDGRVCAGEVPGMGGMGDGKSFMENVRALAAWKLNIRTLHDAAPFDTTLDLFGLTLTSPIMAAPLAGLAAHFAKKLDEPEIVEALLAGCQAGGSLAWTGDGVNPAMFSAALDLIKRYKGRAIITIKPRGVPEILKRVRMAEEAGALAVAIDVDAAGFHAMASRGQPVGPTNPADIAAIVAGTHLPVILKGIMTPDEALLAASLGVAGIVVSNHGGRVLDASLGTADVLPGIAAAVKGKIRVFLDGGVRTGSDVLKALALGAEGVLMGRPMIVAAAGGGAQGVRVYMSSLEEDLVRAMTMTGVASLNQVPSKIVTKLVR